MRARILIAAPALAFITFLTACKVHEPPRITHPDNRIQDFLQMDYGTKKSQEEYQEFIEREIGTDFTEGDYVAYMEANEAECARDPFNAITYCRYVDFKYVHLTIEGRAKTIHNVKYFCFWSLPPPDRPTVRFSQAGTTRLPRFPADRNEFARSINLPGCRTLLLDSIGIEK